MQERSPTLTGIKVSSLAYQCVFCRPEHTAKVDPMEPNFGVLEMQKQNIPTDRAQRLNEKNEVICLVM